jgi:glycerol uptake facilitator-like aquaporin
MAKKASETEKPIKIGIIIAEFIGTFSLAYAVLASINGAVPSVPTAVIAGFTLLLAALSIGGISGAHINPAVTLGLFSIKKISLRNAVFYLLSQFAGALAALGLIALVLHGHDHSVASDKSNWTVFSGEMIGAAIFTFGVAAAVEQGLQKISAAFLVGGSLTLGIVFASIASNGVVNPAVAVAIGSSTWGYIIGPIVGAVVGMNLQHYIRKLA